MITADRRKARFDSPTEEYATVTGEYLAMCRRIIRAAGRRVKVAEPADLADLFALHDAVDEAARTAVAGLRDNGYTWDTIGAALGVTRQAVIKRWAAAEG